MAKLAVVEGDPRFWAKVDRTGPHWAWQGGEYRPAADGRREPWWRGPDEVYVQVRRYALEKQGMAVPRGMTPVPTCGDERCLRRAHHKLVPARAGRHLTREVARAIRERYAKGAAIKALAVEYHLRRVTVQQILKGQAWKDAGGPIVTADLRTVKARAARAKLLAARRKAA